jgi:hypothetical protein
MIQDIDMLLSELLGGERFNTDKRFEHKLYVVLLSQIKIRGLACRRLRLGNENLLYFQNSSV